MKPMMKTGTPSITNPTDINSPPDSEPATPLTSSTHITIPSPVPGKTVIKLGQGVESIARTSVIDATEVPLPPSPPRFKQSLPFRRPRVSNPLSRVVSDTSRTASSPERRVSSALQYAMRPDPEPEPDNGASGRVVSNDRSLSADLDLAYYEQMKGEITDSDEEDARSGDREGEGPTWDSALGFGGHIPHLSGGEGVDGERPSLTGQEEDEAWMGYVRQQLNTLFPDYFEADAISQHITGFTNEEFVERQEGDLSVSKVSTSEVPMPMARSGLIGIPNVRTEIGGLKDEIARLRGVVSELAEDMRGSKADVEPVREATTVEVASLEKPSQESLPAAFIQTGLLSMEIIRSLQTRLIGESGSDTELFSVANLFELKKQVESLDLGKA